VRTRSGDVYKPSAVRSYKAALGNRVLPALGGKRLADVQRRDVQHFADELLGEGLDPSTVRNVLMPLRVIFRRAIEDGELAVNPTGHLRLPAVRGRRERIASPEEAQRLLAALPERDQAVWATALYAGLRRGELMALRWDDVDLASGVIRVERAYDEKGRVHVEPKSHAGRRTVPIVGALRDELVAYKVSSGRDDGLVFGSTPETPLVTSNLWRRAQVAWPRAGLEPIGLHEARHTFASLLIAAGVKCEGDHDLHGPRVDPDNLRAVREAHARLGSRSDRPRRRVPRPRRHGRATRPAERGRVIVRALVERYEEDLRR